MSISNYQICGEMGSVPMQLVQDFRQSFSQTTEGFTGENIFNVDETALYYKVVSCRTLISSKNEPRGHKVSKDRITVLIGCSMLGEKLPVLTIGMSLIIVF